MHMKPNPKPRTAAQPYLNSHAWVAFLDVYGMKNLILLDKTGASIYKRLRAAQDKAIRLLGASGIHWHIFSDSIFMIEPVSARDRNSSLDSLRTITEAVEDVCERFLDYKLVLRGSLSFGHVAHGERILLGEPVIRAVDGEKSFDIPIVFVPIDEIFRSANTRDQRALGEIRLHDVRDREGGKRRGAVIVPRRVDKFLNVAKTEYEHTVKFGPPLIAAVWERAMEALTAILENPEGNPS